VIFPFTLWNSPAHLPEVAAVVAQKTLTSFVGDEHGLARGRDLMLQGVPHRGEQEIVI
jgi:hypothetical protein